MKNIILWGGVGLLIVAAIAASVVWSMRPQVITLKNGTKLTLVSVSYGKHHPFRGSRTTGTRLRGRTSIDTTNDTLVVWIKAESKSSSGQWPNFQLLTYDPDNTACVGAWQRDGSQIKNGVYVEGFTLDAYPRRASKMIVHVSAWNNMGRMETPKGEFVLSNPGPRTYPDWTPDALPDEQSDGDLNVTLTKFDSNSRGFMYGSGMNSPKDPKNRSVSVTLHTEQNGNIVTNWMPVRIETSDATGNDIFNNSWSNTGDTNHDAVMTYQWGLWPGEKAWKLRVEMSRTSGFNSDEAWPVSNVPIQPGTWNDLWNQGPNGRSSAPAVAETTLNGIHLKIYPVHDLKDIHFGPDGQRSGGFRVSVNPALPDGYRLTLAEATDEQGHKLPLMSYGPNGGGDNYVFQLQDLRNAKALNLTIALHKSRFVEFTVKPTAPNSQN